MVDTVSREKRSQIMSLVKGKNTRPERAVRSLLHKMGKRFRLHRADLPGTPDIVLPKHKKVVFVNGCFWHGHRGCKAARIPKTRSAFWRDKIERNRRRDIKNRKALSALGWKSFVVWECEVKRERLPLRILAFLNQN
jgi:DNA mismatch endonuclease (patch repair protein)